MISIHPAVKHLKCYSSPTRNNGNTLKIGHQKAKRCSGFRKGIHPIFNIKLQPFGKEMDQNTLSKYSPPHVSRAGQFTRLVKQGRREEAVDQERSSPTSNYSQEPMDVGSHNEENLHSPVLAPHEDTIQRILG